MATPLNMNTTTLTEGPVGSDKFIQAVFRKAGILRLVDTQQITTQGQSFPIIPKTNVEEVGETELKPQTDAPIVSLVAKPITLATTVPVSKQLLRSKAGIIDALSARGASDIAVELDNKATGTNGTNVTGANFGQLKNVPTSATLTGKASWFGAQATLAAQGFTATGVFASTAYMAELLGEVNDFGINVHNFSDGSDINSGVINGLEYSTFQSSERVAYLGDFRGCAVAGIVYNVETDINEYGVMGEGASAINLWQRNMVGIRCETEVAFEFHKPAFIKLVPAVVPAG